MGTAIVVGLIVFAFFGAPIFAILGALAIFGASLAQPDVSLFQAFSGALARVLHLATSGEGSTLATIPLFTFMGYILAESRTADRLVAFADAAVGWFPGGLAIVTVFVCALFTTVTGASGVTIVAVGGLVMPALLKQGYKERFALGLVTGTGSIGLLFPPALPLIIYGIICGITLQASASGGGEALELVDFDLGRFLFAGIIPGFVLCIAVSLYCVYVALRDRLPRTRFSLERFLSSSVRALPELGIPVIMVLALQVGGMTIPEAAAVTTLYVLILETLVYRDVRFVRLPRISREAMTLVGAIFILVVAATSLTDYFVYARIPDLLKAWMLEHISSKYVFLIALNVFLLAVGFVMEIFTALLVIVPLILPPAMAFGVDPYHLGVIFLLNLEIGYVHPPVGLNLFISAFRFRKPMVDLYWAIIPFLIIMLVVLLVVTYVPQLTPIKAKKAEPTEVAQPAGGAGAARDGGVKLTIRLPDGGVITEDECEKPDVKGDTLAYAECQAKFKLWARCEELKEELDKMECRDQVLAGEDPFSADAGTP